MSKFIICAVSAFLFRYFPFVSDQPFLLLHAWTCPLLHFLSFLYNFDHSFTMIFSLLPSNEVVHLTPVCERAPLLSLQG